MDTRSEQKNTHVTVNKSTSNECDIICKAIMKCTLSEKNDVINKSTNNECDIICNEILQYTQPVTEKKERELLEGLDEYFIFHN